MTKEKLKDLIANITIPEFGQTRNPEEEIERRGYERARGMYAEAKLKVMRSL